MARARHYAHQVVAQQPNVDVKTKMYHLQQAKVSDAEYFDLLNRAELKDNEIFDSRLVQNDMTPTLSGPLDSSFSMSHVLYVLSSILQSALRLNLLTRGSFRSLPALAPALSPAPRCSHRIPPDLFDADAVISSHRRVASLPFR